MVVADGRVRAVSPNSFAAQDEARRPDRFGYRSRRGNAAVLSRAGFIGPYRDCMERRRICHVVPGMPITADIGVGQRTVLKYFLGYGSCPSRRTGLREPQLRRLERIGL